jgi:transposase
MYQLSGLPGLLAPLKAATGGVPERMTAEAWEALDKALANSEIGSYKQARHLLAQHGVVYKDDSSIHRLFKRHQIKAKTGRARHEKADVETQDAFKKTLQLP